jgi:hypothetical protein
VTAPALERALPQTCPACARVMDIHDLPSLRLHGRCVRCRLSGPALRIKEGSPTVSFPTWTLDLASIQRPEGRDAHAGNYVTVED